MRALVALLVFGLLAARSQAEEIEAKDANAPPPPPSKEQGVVVADYQKPGAARDAVTRIRDILGKIMGNLDEARDERDMVKLNCVAEKLAAVKGLLKISEQSETTLQVSLGRRDSESASHEFEKINIAQRKCEQLLAESEACVGELAVYSGDTELEMETFGVPDTDPTVDNDGAFTADKFHEDPSTGRPPAASPFQ